MIQYKGGYKYQLVEHSSTHTGIIGYRESIIYDNKPIMVIYEDGLLVLFAGYAWDGPSGPFTIHSKNFMRGSLFHDALYQLMEEKLLPLSFREEADKLLVKICRDDGMSAIRAAWVYAAVRVFGKLYMDRGNPVITAP